EPDRPGHRGQKTERDKRLVEGVALVVERHPAVAALGAEDVIGDLDIGVAEIFRGLRPISDLRGIRPNIERWDERIELHGSLSIVRDRVSAFTYSRKLVAFVIGSDHQQKQ